MITEDYISYEVAKLLKEKGFEQHKCQHSYDSKGVFKWSDDLDPYEYSAPTHQMACKWLREVHNLHIVIERGPKGYHISIETIPFGAVKYITREIVKTSYVDSYEEAVEVALKYCLKKNLI